jgi:putative nucleotidyltransferase with HDIG domain
VTEPAGLVLLPLLERLRPLLAAARHPVYLVGGTVRDALLGRPIHDIDLIVAADAIPLAFRLGDALGLPAFALDAERDVGRVIAGDDLTLDVARFRGPTLADDLRGRDFTINALALPVASSSLADVIDHHGGLDDLRAGILRAIYEHSIADDPVRAVRAARFAAQLGFDLAAATVQAARLAAGALPDGVSAERLRDELTKLLITSAPQRGVALLHEWGLLAAILPPVAALDGVAQSPPHHEDVLRHTLSVLRYLVAVEAIVIGGTGDEALAGWPADVDQLVAPYRPELQAHLVRPLDGGFRGGAMLRWAGLLHDAGKAATQTIGDDGRIRFLGHDEVGAGMAGVLLSRLAFSNEAARRARTIVAGHMRPLNLAIERRTPSRRAVYRYFRALHEAGLDVGLLSLADHLATYDGAGRPEEWAALRDVIGAILATYFEQYEQTIAPPRLLDGVAIMELLGEPPGHEIGRLLRLLEEAQAAGEINSRDEAIALVRRHHARPGP